MKTSVLLALVGAIQAAQLVSKDVETSLAKQDDIHLAQAKKQWTDLDDGDLALAEDDDQWDDLDLAEGDSDDDLMDLAQGDSDDDDALAQADSDDEEDMAALAELNEPGNELAERGRVYRWRRRWGGRRRGYGRGRRSSWRSSWRRRRGGRRIRCRGRRCRGRGGRRNWWSRFANKAGRFAGNMAMNALDGAVDQTNQEE